LFIGDGWAEDHHDVVGCAFGGREQVQQHPARAGDRLGGLSRCGSIASRCSADARRAGLNSRVAISGANRSSVSSTPGGTLPTWTPQ
jgi:hypothetical protein